MKTVVGVCPECGGFEYPLETADGFWFTCHQHEIKWHQPNDGPWGTYYHLYTPTNPASEDDLTRLAFEAEIDHYREIKRGEAVTRCPKCKA